MTMGGVRSILQQVEGLPPGRGGALELEGRGTILCDARRVCWATAPGCTTRLGELLRHQRNPPLPKSYLTEVVRRCRIDGQRLGEALLATGEISERGLRAALLHQTCEAIGAMADAGNGAMAFRPLAPEAVRHDGRFAFYPAELLAAIAARAHPAVAILARRRLQHHSNEDRAAIALFSPGEDAEPLPIAVSRPSGLRITDVPRGAWARGLVAMASAEPEEAPPSPSGMRARVWRCEHLCIVELEPASRVSAGTAASGSGLGERRQQ